MRRIHPVDVEGRIRLGVAQRLRLGQHVVEGPALGRILVRMKLQVPLRMPATDCTRLAASPSRRPLIAGIPPATAASKYSAPPCSATSAASSAPRSATSALLAVTTALPARSAAMTASAPAPLVRDHLDQHVDVIAHGQRSRISLEGQRRQVHARSRGHRAETAVTRSTPPVRALISA